MKSKNHISSVVNDLFLGMLGRFHSGTGLLRISDKSLTINDITCIAFILLVHISVVINISKWNKDEMERKVE